MIRVIAVVLLASLSSAAVAGQAVEAPRLPEVPTAIAAPPVDAAAGAVASGELSAPSIAIAPLPAAAAPSIERGLRAGPWAISADEEARYQAAVGQAKAELDALFIGRGPAPSPPPEGLADKLRHPFAYRPSAEWAGSGWAARTSSGWRLVVPGAQPLPVARWSSEGNPIVLIDPRRDGVLLRPTQHDLPAPRKYQAYAQGDRMTRLTRGHPLRAFYDPSGSSPQVVVKDGHHRARVAVRTGQSVYVELTGVRRPYEWEERDGRWSSPIF